MIKRQLAKKLLQEANKYRVVTITGPRQSGKTTLVRSAFPKYLYLNLEDPDIRDFAATDPRAFLSRKRPCLILDEIQHVPSLLSYIQTMVDEPGFHGRFILTGSRQFELMRGVNQTLAGRTAVLQLLPLTMGELKQLSSTYQLNDYLWRGFYPKIYDKKLDPTSTYKYYFETCNGSELFGETASKTNRDFKVCLNIFFTSPNT